MNGKKNNTYKNQILKMIASNSAKSPKETKPCAMFENSTKTNFSTISFNEKKPNLLQKEKNSNLKNSKNSTETLNLSNQYLATNNSNTDTSTYLNTINTCSFTSPKLNIINNNSNFNNNNNFNPSGKICLISSNILSSVSTRFLSKNNSKQKSLRKINKNNNNNTNENLILKTEAFDYQAEENNSSCNKQKGFGYLKMMSSTCRNSQNIKCKKFLMPQKNKISHLINFNENLNELVDDSSKNIDRLANNAEEKENLLTNLIKKTFKKSLNVSKRKEKSYNCIKQHGRNSIEKPNNHNKNFAYRNSNVIEKINGNVIPSINNLIQENLIHNVNENKFYNNNLPLKEIKNLSSNSNNNNNFTYDNNFLEFKINFKKNLNNKNQAKKDFSTIETPNTKYTKRSINKLLLNNNNNKQPKSESKSPTKNNPNENSKNKSNNFDEINCENFITIETSKDFIMQNNNDNNYFTNKKVLGSKGNSIANYNNSVSTKKFVFKNSYELKQKEIFIFNSELKNECSPSYSKYKNLQFKNNINNNNNLTANLNVDYNNNNPKAKIFVLPLEQKLNSNVSFLSSDFKEKINEKDFENFFVDESKLTQKDECLITNRKVGIKDNNMKINENPFSKVKENLNFQKINNLINKNSSENVETKSNLRNLFSENMKSDNNENNKSEKNENYYYCQTEQIADNFINNNFNYNFNKNKKFLINKREKNFRNDRNQFEDSLISENNKVFSFRKHENKYATIEDLRKSTMENHIKIAKKIDYYTNSYSPHKVNVIEEQNKTNEINNENVIAFTPFLNKNSAENSNNKNSNKLNNELNCRQQINPENYGLTERLERLGQKYNNLIKEPKATQELNDVNKCEIAALSNNAANYNQLFNILSSNIKEINELIRSENYLSINNNNNNNLKSTLPNNPNNKINNNNLIIKENTMIHKSNKKDNKNNLINNINNKNVEDNFDLKNSEPISNVINYIDNKSSFVFSNDIRRNLNFQDSNLLSNIKLDKKIENRIFSNERSRLFSDSLSLNYNNDFSVNNLNNNQIDNMLDKTEADRFVNLINDGNVFNLNTNKNRNNNYNDKYNFVLKNFEKKDTIFVNENDKVKGDKILKESISNLNDILDYDIDSLIYIDKNNTAKNNYVSNYVYSNNDNRNNYNGLNKFNKIIFENELRDSREYMINNLIDNHIKNKNSSINFHSSDNFYNNKKGNLSNINYKKEYILDSYRSIKNEMNIDKGIYCKTETDNINKNNFDHRFNQAVENENINFKAKLNNSNLDITECQYAVENDKLDYFDAVEAKNIVIDKDKNNSKEGNVLGDNNNNRKVSRSSFKQQNDKNSNCVLF